MSSVISAFAVSLDEIKRAAGSKNQGLLTTIIHDYGSEFDQIDIEEDTVPLEQALRHIVMGEKQDRHSGTSYGFALYFLCRHLGEKLETESWEGMGVDWAEDVDGALEQAGVDPAVFSVQKHLMFRGSPIKIPITDSPCIGYLRTSEIAAASTALSAASFDDVEIKESLSEVGKWFEQCKKANRDLVCFYD